MKLIKTKNFKIGEEIITDSGRKGIVVDNNCSGFFSVMTLIEDTDVLFFDKNGKSENNNISISSILENTDTNKFAEQIKEEFRIGDTICIIESMNPKVYSKLKCNEGYKWIVVYGGLQEYDKIRILSSSGFCVETKHTYCYDNNNIVWGDVNNASLIRMATESEIKLLQQQLKL